MLRTRSLFKLATACVVLFCASGCGLFVETVSKYTPQGEAYMGKTFYVGGAGPIGHVGSFDVPLGLGDGGYQGNVEVFSWQGVTHAGDQINIGRNREKAAELASLIRRYARSYPNREINIIALSAGTGIATFALEYLPESIRVHDVVFLGCSLSSVYDLTRALKRVDGEMYVVYSGNDRVLRDIVWYTGTVDRSDAAQGVAGMEGFRLPSQPQPDTKRLYAKVHNIPYRAEFAAYGYEGGHTDSTSREFVRRYLAPVLNGNALPLLGATSDEDVLHRQLGGPTTRPRDDRNGPSSRPGDRGSRPPGSGDPLRPHLGERQ